jgi:hypothetical protein
MSIRSLLWSEVACPGGVQLRAWSPATLHYAGTGSVLRNKFLAEPGTQGGT